jgi:hypothetical protein
MTSVSLQPVPSLYVLILSMPLPFTTSFLPAVGIIYIFTVGIILLTGIRAPSAGPLTLATEKSKLYFDISICFKIKNPPPVELCWQIKRNP